MIPVSSEDVCSECFFQIPGEFGDHDNYSKTGKEDHDPKKLGCPFKIKMKMLLRFPEYAVC